MDNNKARKNYFELLNKLKVRERNVKLKESRFRAESLDNIWLIQENFYLKQDREENY